MKIETQTGTSQPELKREYTQRRSNKRGEREALVVEDTVLISQLRNSLQGDEESNI